MAIKGICLLFGGIALSLCAAQAAPVYRWVDANGVIHFSQTPPVSGAYKRIEPELPPPTSAPAVKELGPMMEHYQTQREQSQKSREAHVKHAAEREEACAKARQRINFLEAATAHRLFVRGQNGTRSRMTQPQFEKLLNQARQTAAANCRKS